MYLLVTKCFKSGRNIKAKKSETDRRNVVFVAPNCELNSVNFYEKTLSCHYATRQLAPTPTTTLPL